MKNRMPPSSVVNFRSGFTLVELSVAILALSVLFTILFGFFYSISRISKEGTPGASRRARAIYALNHIRTSINNSFYIKNVEQIVFVGKSGGSSGDERKDTLTFASVNPGAEKVGIATVREVSYYVNDITNGFGTIYIREDTPVDMNPGEGGGHYPLAGDIQSLVFRYSADGVNWLEEWNSKKKKDIPRLVQIRITSKIGNSIQKFETLASPGLHDVRQKSVF